MAATILPTAAITVGGQPTIAGYIVESWETSGGNLDQEEFKDAGGAHHSIAVYEKRMAQIDFVLLATSGTGTEFPFGGMCTVASYTDYQVRDVRKSLTKSATRYTGQLVRVTF